MSSSSSPDRESFQQLLANAFAVQESHMDSRSLSAIVQVERLIAKGELELDGAMHVIVDCARNVANATGVAIALLQGNQLVYQAGSGSAASYIGRGRMATLTVPAEPQAGPEILRVENAQTDARIEAAICRQFGAEALLMLLIYHDRSVAGVLEILFSEAHVFQNREIRTYRLMAGLIGEAMSHAAQLERKKNLATEPPTTPRAIEQITPPRENFLNGGGSIFKQPYLPAAMIMRRPQYVLWHKGRWGLTLTAVTMVAVLALWISIGDRRSASLLRSSAPSRSRPIVQQVSVPAATRLAEGTSSLPVGPVLVKEARVVRAVFQRARVAENEVKYIGDDVTVRYFTPKPARHRVRVGENEVDYIGDDVTVRYFTPKPTAILTPIGSAPQRLVPSSSAPAKSISPKPSR
jgi:hypothetical protein